MASETVPCGATIYSLPCASSAPVRQGGRPGRLPKSIASLREARLQRDLAKSKSETTSYMAEPALVDMPMEQKLKYAMSALFRAHAVLVELDARYDWEEE